MNLAAPVLPETPPVLSKLSDNVIEEIQNKLQDIRSPAAAMLVLLREMDLETESELGGEAALSPGRTLEPAVGPRSPAHPCASTQA